VEVLSKNKLLILPLATGIILLVYSWFMNYPLSINSTADVVFNHVSVFYWFGLSLTLASLFLAGITAKSHVWRWIIAVSLVTAMFSISYYYFMLPGSDSQSFRGLNEYYMSVINASGHAPTPSLPSHYYYQWPLFFMLNNVATSVTGLQLSQFDFIIYAVIGFLFATASYVYFAKSWKNGAFVAVACFFLAMYDFLNYQAVPFSFAFALFLLLVTMGDELFASRSGKLIAMLLFVAMTLSHSFVPLFFILFEFVYYVLARKREYLVPFLLTSTIYFVVLVFGNPTFFSNVITALVSITSEYGNIAQASLANATNHVDVLAQAGSRALIVVTLIICVSGFLALALRKRLGNLDKIIFVSGAVYAGVGVVLSVLGSRAIPLLFLPVALGACYLLETRFRRYLKAVVLVLLILFPLIIVHSSFENSQVMFQTKESYITENFMIGNYNWTHSSLVLAHARVVTYLQAKEDGKANFETDFSSSFPSINGCDSILYTVGLGINLQKYNLTSDQIFSGNMLNKVYDDGQSYMAVKSYNFTWARVIG
jgi:hypothetical protein